MQQLHHIHHLHRMQPDRVFTFPTVTEIRPAEITADDPQSPFADAATAPHEATASVIPLRPAPDDERPRAA